MQEQWLQQLISDVLAEVLRERGLASPAALQSASRREVKGRVFVAACCDSCINDDASAVLQKMEADAFEILRPAESEFESRAARDSWLTRCDVVLLPSVGDDDAAKMATGIFDDAVLRVALAALSTGKPLLATLSSTYRDGLKNHSPALHRLQLSHQSTLEAFGVRWHEPAQWLSEVQRIVGKGTQQITLTVPQTTSANGRRAVITAHDIEDMQKRGERLRIPAGAIVTPLARDRARDLGWSLE